jgi:acyl-CoA thioesterase I
MTGGTGSGGAEGGRGGGSTGSISNTGGGSTASGGSTGSSGGSIGGVSVVASSALGGTSGGGSNSADAGPTSKPSSYRIMPFGDSITVTMCPPQLLEQKLKANGFSNFSFVGTKVCNQSCNGAPNTQCEGQGGIWATNLVPGGANPDLLAQWTTGSQYDVVLMHLGTNDCWSPGAVPDLQKVIDAFSVIVDKLRAANPKVIVFVAQIIPLNPANCATCETRVQQLNATIPSWAAGKSTAQSPIYVANLHAAFDGLSYVPNSSYSTDGAHPTPAGSLLMADVWYAALRAHGIP